MKRTVLFLGFSLSLAGSAFLACSSDETTSPVTTGDAGGDSSSPSTDDSGSGGDGGASDPVSLGAKVAQTNGCHDCHDSKAGVLAGNNDGVSKNVAGAGFSTIYAANLTPDPDTGIGTAADGWSDALLERAIRTGVDDECLTLCSVMPKFDTTKISAADMTNLIAYIRSVPAVSNTVDNQGCPSVDAGVSHAGELVDAGDCPPPEEEPDAGTDAGDGG